MTSFDFTVLLLLMTMININKMIFDAIFLSLLIDFSH